MRPERINLHTSQSTGLIVENKGDVLAILVAIDESFQTRAAFEAPAQSIRDRLDDKISMLLSDEPFTEEIVDEQSARIIIENLGKLAISSSMFAGIAKEALDTYEMCSLDNI